MTLTSNTSGPVTTGTSVALTANAACGAGDSAQYQFTAQPEGSTSTTVVRAFESGNQATWNTTGLASGKWRITVSVRNTGTTAVTASSTLAVHVGSVCLNPTITASPMGAAPGTTIALTASSTCTSGTPQYRFYVRAPGGAYVEARTWGAATYSWETTGLANGTYGWKVESRATGNPVADSSGLSSYVLSVACGTNLAVSASPLNAAMGVPVSVSASVACNGASVTPQLRFAYRASTGPTYTVFRDWETGPATWDTTGLAPGAYTVRVESRAQGTTAVQASKVLSYQLGGSCTAVNLSAPLTSPQDIGATLALTGAATCSPGVSPEYRFLMRAPSATADVELRGWGSSSFAWSTTGAIAGTYKLTVQARAHSLVTTPVQWSTSLQLGKLCTSVVANILPTTTQPAGAPIYVNAVGGCYFGGAAEYRFSSRLHGTATWSVFRDWSPLSAAARDTSLDAAGRYELLTEVRGLGQTASAPGSHVLSYTLSAACASGLVPDGTDGCAAPEACGVPFVAQGDIRGGAVAFAGGATLPAGTYTLSYTNGCMRYAATQAWTLHATASGVTGWVVGAEGDDEFEAVAPGTVGYVVGRGGYSTYEKCVAANNATSAVTFTHATGPLNLWLNDSAYTDNLAGKQPVTFTLTRECPVARCDDGIKNGTETDIDCGGACAPCGAGRQCISSMDCNTYSCTAGTCQNLMCPPLAPPPNGMVSPPWTPAPVGAIATYYCDFGFQLWGPPSIMCYPNGMWSGPTPTCMPINCGYPPSALHHARLEAMTGITYGSYAHYSCDLGYETSDSTTLMCGSYGSWGMPPSCTERVCTGYHEDDQEVLTTVSTGANPQEIAVNPVTHKAYVANHDGSSVTVIDGRTGAPTNVPVGRGPVGIGINSQTNKIYVANYGTSQDPDNTVTIIDGNNDTVVTTLTVAPNPYFIAVNEATNKIYVTQYGFSGNSLTVIDGSTDSATNVPLAHGQPEQVVVNPVTNKVYVTHVDGFITVLDGATHDLTYVNNGTRMSGVAVNTQTNEVYFTNYFTGPFGNSGGTTLSKLNGETNAITLLPVGTSPVRVAVDEVRNIILVTNYDSSSVTVLDGATGQYIGEVYVAANPLDIKLNPVSGEAYVATADHVWVLFGEDYLSKWGLYSNNSPGFLAVDSSSGFVYFGLPAVGDVGIVTPCVPRVAPQ